MKGQCNNNVAINNTNKEIKSMKKEANRNFWVESKYLKSWWEGFNSRLITMISELEDRLIEVFQCNIQNQKK